MEVAIGAEVDVVGLAVEVVGVEVGVGVEVEVVGQLATGRWNESNPPTSTSMGTWLGLGLRLGLG